MQRKFYLGTALVAALSFSAAAYSQGVDGQTLLNAHNIHRDKHCVPRFQWSGELAASAQAWANGCHKDAKGDFCHQNDCGTKTSFGENLSWGWRESNGRPVLPGQSAQDAVDGWYSEIQAYNFAKPALRLSPPANGHFTQVVWRGSTQIGCAEATCPINANPGFKQGTLWVCKYSPASNNPQILVQNVQRPCK
jgi:glioma pathogenesis-related protein 2